VSPLGHSWMAASYSKRTQVQQKISLHSPQCKWMIAHMAKRDRQVSLRLSGEDLDLMLKAAATMWHKAAMSTAGIVASLARWKAEEILKGTRKGRDVG